MPLTPMERVTQAKISLQRERPFFAYLIMRLSIKQAGDQLKAAVPTMAVNALGSVVFNEDFLAKLNDSEVKAVFAHEVMHVALLHIARKPHGADCGLWNWAIDIVDNALLAKEGFKLPKGGLIPDEDMSIKIEGKTIKNVDKLCAEEIYHWLVKHFKKPPKGGGGGFDSHDYSAGDGEGQEISAEMADKIGREWRDNIASAAQMARQRGLLSAGLAGLVDDSLAPKVDWRTVLLRFISRHMPAGWTWSRPHKKCASLHGIYLPSVVKEGLEVVVHVDSSGSIGGDQLATFFSEIRGMLEMFTGLKMLLIICDAAIQGEPYELDVNNWRTFVAEGKPLGRGGTSHTPVVDWINAKRPETKVFVTFTDGYSDMEQALPRLPYGCNKLILLSRDSDAAASRFENLGEVIHVD